MKRLFLVVLCTALLGFIALQLHGFPGPICSRAHASEDEAAIEKKIADLCQETIDSTMREDWAEYLRDKHGLTLEEGKAKFEVRLFKRVDDKIVIVVGDLNIVFSCTDKMQQTRRFVRDAFVVFHFDTKTREIVKSSALHRAERIEDGPTKI